MTINQILYIDTYAEVDSKILYSEINIKIKSS